MDNNQSAILWQLMQSLTNTQEAPASPAEESRFEHNLLSLRPLLAPKQQKILDLLIKLQEVRALVNEIYG